MADVNPAVPAVPGVPALLRTLAAPVQPILLLSDTFTGFGGGVPPVWGVFSAGGPVVLADTVVDFGYRRDWAIADYPVESGGFQSYDKVDIPFDARVRFAAGGSLANRAALLASIEAIAGDLNLYDVVTPERVYVSVNVQHFDYRRTAHNGLGLLTVDLWLLEVRITAAANGQNTQSPSGANATPDGSVQPSDPVPATDPLAGQLGGIT